MRGKNKISHGRKYKNTHFHMLFDNVTTLSPKALQFSTADKTYDMVERRGQASAARP